MTPDLDAPPRDRADGPDAGGPRPDAAGSGDVAELRRRLRETERRFRSIIQKTADGMIVVDIDEGVIRFANEAAGRLFGRDPDSLIGSPFGHPMVVGETTEIDLVREGEPLVAELRVMQTEWEGEAARIVSLRDVTGRKEAEEQERELIREQAARAEAEEAARRAEFLAEAARRLSSSLALDEPVQQVLDLVVDGFADYVMLDLMEDGDIRRFAAAGDGVPTTAEELAGFPLSLSEETPQARAFRRRDAVLVRRVDEEWIREAAQDDAHAELIRRLEPRSVLFAPLDSGRECIGLLLAARTRPEPFRERDLHTATELARHMALAIDNARLYRSAEAANKAKADFLSVMSHELRTPLSAIIGYTDLIDRGVVGEVTEKQAQYLNRIRASSNHLLQIIEEILAFAGTEAGKDELHLEDMSLAALLESVEAVSEPLASETGLDFRFEVEGADTPLHTDERKVRQILLNLISNALKFTEEGSVVVRVRPVEDDRIRFDVEDTGVGIPEDKQEAIFERFWQMEEALTRTAGGTGLGLTVARTFAERLGGSLTVDSAPGKGSTFTLLLPRASGA